MVVAPSHAQLIATGLEMNSEGAILALENEAGEQANCLSFTKIKCTFVAKGHIV